MVSKRTLVSSETTSLATFSRPSERSKTGQSALNKISGDWEVEALAKLMAELDQSQSLDATATGFDTAEIAELIEKATGAAGDQPAEVDAVDRRFAVAVVCDSRRQRDRMLRELRAAGHEVVSCAYEAVVRGKGAGEQGSEGARDQEHAGLSRANIF